mmetsp:Transcript_40007/g.45520  ORF Transcript_40007/g.45520 Transcript_40007/m.45520 type:complete len:90 (-) Transcript_40007:197-466(-)
MNYNEDYPYRCVLEFSLPNVEIANRSKLVLEVDEEVGNRVRKNITLALEDPTIIRVTFEATETKMLRVAVSTFCDYMNVTLKCQQEFLS